MHVDYLSKHQTDMVLSSFSLPLCVCVCVHVCMVVWVFVVSHGAIETWKNIGAHTFPLTLPPRPREGDGEDEDQIPPAINNDGGDLC